MIDLPIMRNHQSPPLSPPPDSIFKRDALILQPGFTRCSACVRVVLLAAVVRSHVEQEQSRALGSRAGGGCWADCPAVWARGAASTRPDLSSGPACSLGAEERLAPRRGSRRLFPSRHAGVPLTRALGRRCAPHDLRAYVVEHLGDDDAVLVLNETGLLKKGVKSAGVHRQYSGTAGRIENCQIGVFLAYATRHGHALIDRAVYLPKTWTDDPSRCRNAGIPDEVTFTTKPKIGRAMLERALTAHLPFAWVTGDSVYGADSALRRSIEAASKGYVLTVTSAQHLGLRPVGDWATEVPKDGWTRLSAGDGAKGPRLYDWACVPFRGAREGWQKALLIRRALEKPDELSFYLTLAPEGTELATLVQVAGTRWTIEACFEAAKGEVGLDEYEVRSWTGWHRHVTLAMLAHAYLAVVRQHAIRGRGPRPRGRLAAPYGSRGAPAHLASRLGKAARSRSHPRLVGLATTTPAARQTITLDPQNQNPSTPAVVLMHDQRQRQQPYHADEGQAR